MSVDSKVAPLRKPAAGVEPAGFTSLRRFERPERGLWRFLTWSFFLAQLGAVDSQFNGAKASGVENDADFKHHPDDTAGFQPADFARGEIRVSGPEADEEPDSLGKLQPAALPLSIGSHSDQPGTP